jgi:hypothetical protein
VCRRKFTLWHSRRLQHKRLLLRAWRTAVTADRYRHCRLLRNYCRAWCEVVEDEKRLAAVSATAFERSVSKGALNFAAVNLYFKEGRHQQGSQQDINDVRKVSTATSLTRHLHVIDTCHHSIATAAC